MSEEEKPITKSLDPSNVVQFIHDNKDLIQMGIEGAGLYIGYRTMKNSEKKDQV